MFEYLKDRRVFFDWRTNTIYEKVDGKRVEVDYDKVITESGYNINEVEKMYEDWINTVNMLAYEYSMSTTRNNVDCPVVNQLDSFDRFIGYGKGEDYRIELCSYMFVGIHYGFMKWKWENQFFHKLNNIILWKKWFCIK